MEIEAEINVAQLSYARSSHETYLVERGIGLAAIAKGLPVTLYVEPERPRHIRLAEESDTGRIGTHGRNIGPQGIHSTTHTHKASRTVQVLCRQLGSHIGVARGGHLLCLCAHGRQGHSCK